MFHGNSSIVYYNCYLRTPYILELSLPISFTFKSMQISIVKFAKAYIGGGGGGNQCKDKF